MRGMGSWAAGVVGACPHSRMLLGGFSCYVCYRGRGVVLTAEKVMDRDVKWIESGWIHITERCPGNWRRSLLSSYTNMSTMDE